MKVSQDNLTLLTEETIGEIENVDVAEALTLLSQNTTTIEASYATLSRLNSLSLLEFI
jgi:flagellar hook-associated protein 3 FlgL